MCIYLKYLTKGCFTSNLKLTIIDAFQIGVLAASLPPYSSLVLNLPSIPIENYYLFKKNSKNYLLIPNYPKLISPYLTMGVHNLTILKISHPGFTTANIIIPKDKISRAVEVRISRKPTYKIKIIFSPQKDYRQDYFITLYKTSHPNTIRPVLPSLLSRYASKPLLAGEHSYSFTLDPGSYIVHIQGNSLISPPGLFNSNRIIEEKTWFSIKSDETVEVGPFFIKEHELRGEILKNGKAVEGFIEFQTLFPFMLFELGIPGPKITRIYTKNKTYTLRYIPFASKDVSKHKNSVPPTILRVCVEKLCTPYYLPTIKEGFLRLDIRKSIKLNVIDAESGDFIKWSILHFKPGKYSTFNFDGEKITYLDISTQNMLTDVVRNGKTFINAAPYSTVYVEGKHGPYLYAGQATVKNNNSITVKANKQKKLRGPRILFKDGFPVRAAQILVVNKDNTIDWNCSTHLITTNDTGYFFRSIECVRGKRTILISPYTYWIEVPASHLYKSNPVVVDKNSNSSYIFKFVNSLGEPIFGVVTKLRLDNIELFPSSFGNLLAKTALANLISNTEGMVFINGVSPRMWEKAELILPNNRTLDLFSFTPNKINVVQLEEQF